MPTARRRPTEVKAEHTTEVPPRNAIRGCAMCNGRLRITGKPAYHKWRGERRVCVTWACQDCGTGGNVLRDTDTGEVVRLSHVITGKGFETLGEEEFTVEPESWTVD